MLFSLTRGLITALIMKGKPDADTNITCTGYPNLELSQYLGYK